MAVALAAGGSTLAWAWLVRGAGAGEPRAGAGIMQTTPIRSIETDEIRPDHGVLMVGDVAPAGQASAVLSDRSPTGDDPVYPRRSSTGTIARSGPGWLQTSAEDTYNRVRLEVHGGPPPDDHGAWQAVVDVPYRSQTGWVALAGIMTSPRKPQLQLGEPGMYVVRVSMREARSHDQGQSQGPSNDGQVWLLRFWPQANVTELPRWLVRNQAPTYTLHSIWDDALGWPAEHLAHKFRFAIEARSDHTVTLDQIDAVGRAWGEPPGWLDRPIWPERPPARPLPPTGHPDLDAQRVNQRAAAGPGRDEDAEQLAAAATQLKVAVPRTPREVIPLLVAAGIIQPADGGARYQLGDPGPVDKRLRIPPERLAQMKRVESMRRYQSLCADLLSVVFWAPHSPATFTVAALATRLAARPQEVRETLGYASERGWLTIEGDASNPTTTLSLTLHADRDGWDRRPSEGRVRYVAAGAHAITSFDAVPAAAPPGSGTSGVRVHIGLAPPPRPTGLMALALGAPPRAGFVDYRGHVVVWRDGKRVELTAPGGQRTGRRAYETAFGTLMANQGGLQLVHPDGRADTLTPDKSRDLAVSEDGHKVAYIESHIGRRSSHRLHLLDLASGRREDVPLPDDGAPAMVAIHGGSVYLRSGTGTLRWQPGGGPPVALSQRVEQIEPLSGVGVHTEWDKGVTLVQPGGAVEHVFIDPTARLAPGGRTLYSFRPQPPPAVTLFDLPLRDRPRIHPVPPETILPYPVPDAIWEDEHHLLFLARYPWPGDPCALRLDVRTGALERAPLTGSAEHNPVLVQPLLRQ